MDDDACCNMVADKTFANRNIITARPGGAVVRGEKFLAHTLYAQDYRRRGLAHDGEADDPEFMALRQQFGLPAAPVHGVLALSMAQQVLDPAPAEMPREQNPKVARRAPKV